MNITPDIASKLRAYDLTTEAAALKAYEAISSSLSPLLLSLIRDRRISDMKNLGEAIAKESGEYSPMTMAEAMRRIIAEEVAHYVTTRRSRYNREALRSIKNRLGILLAKWEDEASRKEAGELPVIDGEDYGFIVDYATRQGLIFPSGKKSLTRKEMEALDLTADKILHTIEAYLLYALTLRPTSSIDTAHMTEKEEIAKAISTNAREEVNTQWDAIDAPEWSNSEGELTSSFEEEVQFFPDEAYRYIYKVLTYFKGEDGGTAKGLNELLSNPIKRERDTAEEEAADKERALNSRYKDYLKF